MGRVYHFNGISIYLYYSEHNPPHIHAEYAEYEGLFRISDGKLLKGYLPKRQLRLVQEWLASDASIRARLENQFYKMNPDLRRK